MRSLCDVCNVRFLSSSWDTNSESKKQWPRKQHLIDVRLGWLNVSQAWHVILLDTLFFLFWIKVDRDNESSSGTYVNFCNITSHFVCQPTSLGGRPKSYGQRVWVGRRAKPVWNGNQLAVVYKASYLYFLKHYNANSRSRHLWRPVNIKSNHSLPSSSSLSFYYHILVFQW